EVLDAIDARQPDLAESQNLRGVVLKREGDYDKAEAALRKALDIEPKFWDASFNLAEIPFLKKDWGEARNRFEALVAGDGGEMRPETKLLIQYKILLTFVVQGKENMVNWIMNKFEGEKQSPALYYSKAAFAFHHHNQKEAKQWMDAAVKQYPASLNKLFAESFYEIGWMAKPSGESLAAIEITSADEWAERMKADAQANFELAKRAFQQRDFPATLKFLDLAEKGAPNHAASYNLRGEVFMEQKKFDQAEEQFRKAFTADPKFGEAQYNLAQIPFKEKDYTKSRERFEALNDATPAGDKSEAAQLIKYKIYMTLLLQGNDSEAQRMMDQFKFAGETPALYYAQAAWSFKHGNNDQGNDWMNSARKIYSPALNMVFADSFSDLGWAKDAPETPLTTNALARANASPAAGPKPEMRFGEAGGIPAPAPAEPQPAGSL
ncbi:MAG: tetratricopeptide repeat protein, partial [Chthoniobacterales bacterium]